MHDQRVRLRREYADGCQVAQHVDRHLAVEAGIDGDGGVGDAEQGVAIGRRLRGEFRADIAVRAGAIVDHELLARRVAERLAEHARDEIGAAARRIRHDHAHSARGERLAGGGCAGGEQRGKQQNFRNGPHGCRDRRP